MILATFDLQVTPMLPTKFEVNWLFGSGEEAKNTFSRWPPWWPSWNSNRNNFSYFWSKSHPDASYQVLSQLAQGCRRSRLLKQLLTPHDGRRTLTDHNSSPMSTSCSGKLIMVMIMKILTPQTKGINVSWSNLKFGWFLFIFLWNINIYIYIYIW